MTRRQRDLLAFIAAYQHEHRGISPSVDEMRLALGLALKSGIHRIVLSLEAHGFLRRVPHRARALEVLRLPAVARGEALGPAEIAWCHTHAAAIRALIAATPDGDIAGRAAA